MKTVSLDRLISFLDTRLQLNRFPDDESINGLQVEGKKRIRRIGVAVDACFYVFDMAARKNIDFLLVHHGLIWRNIKTIRDIFLQRIKILLDNNLSLYACHLPLDWHPEYGNNARIAKLLHLNKIEEFGEYHGKKIGYMGIIRPEIHLSDFKSRVDKLLKTNAKIIDFNGKVKKVGIVSGGGWSAIFEAEKYNIDTFLTGEPSHSAYTLAEEMKVNLVFAGHYATEIFGVIAIGNVIKKQFGIDVEFIEHPTGL